MSYYGGGYTSYTSYSSYGTSMDYSYNSGYDSTSCYYTGNYLNNVSNYLQEVRYGSYASQCANWQNTAMTITLWHLIFPEENGEDWQPDDEKIVNISLHVDEAEEELECFMEGTLAFLEQISGKMSNDSQEIIISFPDNIKTVKTDFYHGMLAFLIEIYGFDYIKSRISVQSLHSGPENAYKTFIESYEQISLENQKKVAVIKKAIWQTKDLHDANEEIISKKRRTAKICTRSAVAGIPAALGSAFMFYHNEITLFYVGIAITVICAITLIFGLANISKSTKLQKKTLDSLAGKSSIIEQLDALEERT